MNLAPISCEELINLKGQRSEAERYLDNNEKRWVSSLKLKETLRLSQIEVSNGIENFLQIERAVEGYKLKVKTLKMESDSLESK